MVSVAEVKHFVQAHAFRHFKVHPLVVGYYFAFRSSHARDIVGAGANEDAGITFMDQLADCTGSIDGDVIAVGLNRRQYLTFMGLSGLLSLDPYLRFLLRVVAERLLHCRPGTGQKAATQCLAHEIASSHLGSNISAWPD